LVSKEIKQIFSLGNGSKEKHDFLLDIVANDLRSSGEYIWIVKNFFYPFSGREKSSGEVDILALREDEVLEIYEIKSNVVGYHRGINQLKKSSLWLRRNEREVEKRIENLVKNGAKILVEKSVKRLKLHKSWFEKHDGYKGVEMILCYPVLENGSVRIIYHEFDVYEDQDLTKKA